MFLNSKLNSISESTTIRLNAQAQALATQGIPVANLTAGELDFETPSFIQAEVAQQLKKNKYTPTLGLPELKTAIARDCTKHYKLPIKSQNVAVTAGAKQALSLIMMTLLNPGDEVIIPTPAWVSYEHQVTLCGGKPMFVPLTKSFDLNISAIKKAITKRTKALIINSPHNPTGAIISSASLRALANLLKRNPNLTVISDDIYDRLLYTTPYHPFATFVSSLDQLILVNGFSKSHALTGWRIGYLIASQSFIKALGTIQSHINGNAPLPSQYAALAALKRDASRSFLRVLTKRRTLVEKALRKIPNITWHTPQGAFYFFINVSKIEPRTDMFCERLLSTERVALVPGETFRAPGWIRMSFACDEQTLTTGLTRLKHFLSRHPL